MIRLGISRDTGIRLHFFFEGLSYAAAAATYLFQRRRSGDVVGDPDRLFSAFIHGIKRMRVEWTPPRG